MFALAIDFFKIISKTEMHFRQPVICYIFLIVTMDTDDPYITNE